MRKLIWIICLLVMGVAVVPTTLAQSRSVTWERWDVVIDNINTSGNQFNVTEIYDLRFEGSMFDDEFRFGRREISRTNLGGITNAQVSQAGQPLERTCSGGPGTFCVVNGTDATTITYYFFEPILNDTASFDIEYTVEGALRSYEGGDQLWWSAIPSEHFGFPINASTVTVDLPDGFAPREGVDPVVTFGASTDIDVRGTEVTAVATERLTGDESLEIRVQYPHDPNMAPPGWQAAFDRQRAFDETVLPFLNLIFLVSGLVLSVGGSLFVVSLWYRRGRDPDVGPVPSYLSEPPSDLSPGVVGCLVDEKAHVRDVMSVIVDMMHKGYMVMEEDKEKGLFGLGGGSEFTFKRTDKPLDNLRPHEKTVMDKIFSKGSKDTRELDDLKNSFYTTIPRVKDDLYEELVHEGFFERTPDGTRNLWAGISVGIVVLASLGLFLTVNLLVQAPQVLCLPLGLFVVGIVAAITGRFMPAKTRKGSVEAAKWLAFGEYLRNLEKYAEAGENVEQFERYLPYAIAFGVDRTWIRRFSRIDRTPIPTWYFPTYVGGPFSGGYTPGTPVGRPVGNVGSGMPGEGDLARAGGDFSLEGMSGSMGASLSSMSDGLTSMLNSASSTITSQPSSSGSSGSWSSGGSSFSGGGFSGGGFSGGGSSGFG